MGVARCRPRFPQRRNFELTSQTQLRSYHNSYAALATLAGARSGCFRASFNSVALQVIRLASVGTTIAHKRATRPNATAYVNKPQFDPMMMSASGPETRKLHPAGCLWLMLTSHFDCTRNSSRTRLAESNSTDRAAGRR